MNVAAVMTGVEQIKLHKRAMPTPRAGRAVVRVRSVGVCGSDVAYFRHGRIGDYIVQGEMILGHETAGEVVAVGPDVTTVTTGERVAIEPGKPCRDCAECARGSYHLCGALEFLATPPYDGSLVQYLEVDARQLFRLPDGMSYEDGALIEPLSVGLWGCQRAELRAGETVLVIGAGPVGLLAAEAARALGAGRVTVVDVSDYRLALAAQHGFDVERADAPTNRMCDVMLECSGAPGALAGSLKRMSRGGRVAVIGLEKSEVIGLPLAAVMDRELTIALVHRYQFTWPLAIALVSDGRIDLSGIVTHHFSLEQTADALNLSRDEPKSMKAVIDPSAN